MGEVYIDANSRDALRDMKADYDLRMAGAQGRIRTPASPSNKYGGMAAQFIGFVKLGAWDTSNLGYAWKLLERNATNAGWDTLTGWDSTALGLACEVNDNVAIPLNTIVPLFRAKDANGLPRNIFVSEAVWLAIKITGAMPLAGQPNMWSYTYTEQKPGAPGLWVDKPGGQSGSNAYNSMEANNSASGIQGNGIDLSTLPAGSVLLPIRGNPVVWATPLVDCNGNPFLSFAAVNQTQCGAS